ncbi:hypothetical protein IWQ56_006957, partial [Coemansia nantahalensis]
RPAARAAAGRGRGPGVPAAGRRLRRVVRLLQPRGDRGQAQDPAADESGADLGHAAADCAHRADGRAVRQAALEPVRDGQRRADHVVPRRQRQQHRPGAAAARPAAAALGILPLGVDHQLRAAAAGLGVRGHPQARGVGSGPCAQRRDPPRVPDDREPPDGRVWLHGRHWRGKQPHAGPDHGGHLLVARGAAPGLRAGAHAAHRQEAGRGGAKRARGRAEAAVRAVDAAAQAAGARAVRLVQPVGALYLDRRPHAAAQRRAHRVLPRGAEPRGRQGRAEHGRRRAGARARHPRPAARARTGHADHQIRRRQDRRLPAGARQGGAGDRAPARVVLRPVPRQHDDRADRAQDAVVRRDH